MDDVRPIIEQFGVRPVSLVEPLGAAGGMSGALFWRVTTAGGRFALRRWPVEHPPAERLRFIHAVLRHAFERGCRFLPVPVRDRRGESFVAQAGHLWEISPWMPGEADYQRSPSGEKLAAAMATLATFHLAAATFGNQFSSQFAGRPNAITKRLVRLQELRVGGIESLSRAIVDSHWPEFARLAREFVELLPRALPKVLALVEPLAGVPLLLQPCLRDIWHDHVLFSGTEVTGIVDFGAVDVDTPATDVARLLGSLVGDDKPDWQTGLAAYSAVRLLSGDELAAVAALDAGGTLLAGCNWIRWIYGEGRWFDNRGQVVVRFARLLERVKAL